MFMPEEFNLRKNKMYKTGNWKKLGFCWSKHNIIINVPVACLHLMAGSNESHNKFGWKDLCRANVMIYDLYRPF